METPAFLTSVTAMALFQVMVVSTSAWLAVFLSKSAESEEITAFSTVWP
jgi:hypothetical protein